MTHEELLTKIKDDEVLEYFRAYPALLAVVELHKPRSGVVDWCEWCQHPYPCPTIQAIEKELN